jgi:hypothetical protein
LNEFSTPCSALDAIRVPDPAQAAAYAISRPRNSDRDAICHGRVHIALEAQAPLAVRSREVRPGLPAISTSSSSATGVNRIVEMVRRRRRRAVLVDRRRNEKSRP